MSANAQFYETVYVLKAGVSDSDASTINQKVDNVISKFDGSLKHRDDWGIKELAYPINKERSGRYVVVNYSGKNGVVEEIERHFKILDDVIRFITVRVPEDYDYSLFRKQVHAQEEEQKKSREFNKDGPRRKFGREGGGREGGFSRDDRGDE